MRRLAVLVCGACTGLLSGPRTQFRRVVEGCHASANDGGPHARTMAAFSRSKQGRLLARAETALIEADEQNARVESTAVVLSQSQRRLEGEGEKLRQREEEVRRVAVQLERRLETTNKAAVAK